MKTHTEKILEELKTYECKSCGSMLRRISYPVKCSCGALHDYFINNQVDGFIKKSQLKEAERHDRIIEKIKKELCYEMTDKDSARGNMDSISQGEIWSTIDKIDQEEEDG